MPQPFKRFVDEIVPSLLEPPRFVLTDCATPHQGEVFHTVVLDGPPGTPYAGDAATSTLANQLCTNAFAGYIGVDLASSRLSFLYFYPSVDSWSTGDRSVVCIVYGSEPEELFRGSNYQTGQ